MLRLVSELLPPWTSSEKEMLARLAAVAITLLLALAVFVLLRRGFLHVFRHRESYRVLAVRLLSWMYFPFVGLIVLEELGVDLGELWIVLSATAALIAVGFVAAWSLLSNVTAAFLIFLTQEFAVGDEVELLEPTAREGLRGKVVDLNLVYTKVQQRAAGDKGRIVVHIPNNIFFQKALRIRYGGAELPNTPEDGS